MLNQMARQLASLKGQHGAPVHISVPGLKSEPSAEPPPLVHDNDDEDDGESGGGGKTKANEGDAKAKAAAKLQKQIGRMRGLVAYDTGKQATAKTMTIGKSEGNKETYNVIKFHELDGVPAHACAPVWCSKHKTPDLLCTEIDLRSTRSPKSRSLATRRWARAPTR